MPMFNTPTPGDQSIPHESHYKNLLQAPFPEVLNFNLSWGLEPKRNSILRTLIAIP